MALPHVSTGQLITAGGEINAWIDAINGLSAVASRGAEFAAGNSGSGITINFGLNGPLQNLTRNGNTTITLVGLPVSGTAILRLIHDGTATAYTVTFSPLVKWANSTPPTWTNTAGGIDLVTLYWNGSWWGNSLPAMG
jgi:hypothetical protein